MLKLFFAALIVFSSLLSATAWMFVPSGDVAWTPASAANLYLWLKADAGITESGGLISQWDDQSGNGYNATASLTLRPAYNATGLNSLPIVTFDGSNDRMGVTLGADQTAFTLCFVARTTTQVQFDGLMGFASGAGSGTGAMAFEISTVASLDVWINNVAATGRMGNNTFPNTTWNRACYTYSTPDLKGYASNVLKVTSSSASSFIDSGFNIGNADTFGYFDGSMAEIALWSRVLTSQEMIDWDAYAVGKYAL